MMVADNPLPDPPVPENADLRGMDFMPLKGERLFNSVTWLEASYEGRCAALRTWWHAFSKEVPAGSLPDNDRLLASYAGYGESVKAWAKIRLQAMRGWYKCSDGRLYHKVLADVVVEAWERRLDHRDEQDARAERQRRWRERLKKLSTALRAKGVAVPRGAKMETLERLCRDAGVDVSILESDADVDVYRDASETQARLVRQGQGERQGQGQGQGKEVKEGSEPNGSGKPPPTGKDLIFGPWLAWLMEKTEKTRANCASQLGKWRKVFGNDEALLAALVRCKAENIQEPMGWMEKSAEAHRRDVEPPAPRTPEEARAQLAADPNWKGALL